MKCSHHKIDRYKYTHIRSYNIILTSSTIIYPSYTHYTRIISASSVISYITSCHSEFIVQNTHNSHWLLHPKRLVEGWHIYGWEGPWHRWLTVDLPLFFFGAKCGGCSSQNHTKPVGQNVESPRSNMISHHFPSFRSCPNISGWWCNNHLEKYEFVNGKDDIPYMKWKITHVWNHQPIYIYIILCQYIHIICH